MIAWYVPVKSIHVLCVMASGGLFCARGLLVLKGKSWAMAKPLRYLSYSIDSMLLAAGLSLAAMLPADVFSNGWLGVKLALLVAYVVLGSFALKRGRTPGIRSICFVLAIAVFAFMLSVAHLHQPLGWFY